MTPRCKNHAGPGRDGAADRSGADQSIVVSNGQEKGGLYPTKTSKTKASSPLGGKDPKNALNPTILVRYSTG